MRTASRGLRGDLAQCRQRGQRFFRRLAADPPRSELEGFGCRSQGGVGGWSRVRCEFKPRHQAARADNRGAGRRVGAVVKVLRVQEGRPSSPPQLAAQESFAVGSDQTSPPSPPRPEPPKVVHPEDWSPELAFPKDVYGAGGRRGDALLPSPPPLPPPPPPAAGRGFAARARTAGTVGRPLPPPPPPAVPHKEVFAEKPLPRVACAQGHTLKARPNEREAPAPRCTADANSSPEPEVQVPSVLDMLMPKPVLLTPSFFNHLRHSSSSYSASLHGSEVPSNRRWA
mmetsp:Transcript_30517/g.101484  ORF Transcript_30517/g.101484 Transcript_30517/m.101484 type:complete len:284 (-) Transcript_30517:34-885(-)